MNPYAARLVNNNAGNAGYDNNNANNWDQYESNRQNQWQNNPNINQRQPNNHNNDNHRQSNSRSNQTCQSQHGMVQSQNSPQSQAGRSATNPSCHQNQSLHRQTHNQYTVLYTHQKSKKKPTWYDGRLTLTGLKATLYDANPLPGSGDVSLDSLELSHHELHSLKNGECGDLESERYKIQVEGPWRPVTSSSRTNGSVNSGPSAGMRKILNKKFVVPRKVVPNFEEQRRLRAEKVNKRRRVLQPGELERMYGVNQASFDGQNGYCNEFENYQQNGNRNEFQQQRYYRQGDKGYNNSSFNGGHPNNDCSNQDSSSKYNQGNNNGFNKSNSSNNQVDIYDNGFQSTFSLKGRDNDTMSAGSRRDLRDNHSNFNQKDIVKCNTSQYNGGLMAFQSNGIDASGFYEEEEEEEEDNDAKDCTGNTSHANQTNIEDDTRHYDCLPEQSSTHDKDQQDTIEHIKQFNSYQKQSDEPVSQDRQSQVLNGDDQRVTDELLVLLGATSVPREEISDSNNNDNVSTDQGNGNYDSSNLIQGENDNLKECTDSFLASLKEDDDDDKPMAFDFNNQQYDEGSSDDGDYMFDHDNSTSYEENSNAENTNTTSRQDGQKESTSQIIGLNLPSAGESSSEDEDSLAEE